MGISAPLTKKKGHFITRNKTDLRMLFLVFLDKSQQKLYMHIIHTCEIIKSGKKETTIHIKITT